MDRETLTKIEAFKRLKNDLETILKNKPDNYEEAIEDGYNFYSENLRPVIEPLIPVFKTIRDYVDDIENIYQKYLAESEVIALKKPVIG